jgi:hypothetical protein
MTNKGNNMLTDEIVIFPLSDAELKKRNEELSKLVKAAEEALHKAQAFADKYHLEFGWYPAYGMGGHYYGAPDEKDSDGYTDREHGWRSSSQSC